MPTNLPPDYYDVEKRYRQAESPAEKVALLEEMYSIVPKHKGTDHLRADLRRQISRFKDEAEQARKKQGGRAPVFYIPKEGAGQVVIIGPTNTGKSMLVDALTNAQPEVSPAPYTTWLPTPGMMAVENVQVQLVDTPPLDKGYNDPGLFDLLRRCDLAVLALDLQADPFEQYETALQVLREHRIIPAGSTEDANAPGERLTYLPLLIIANKCDDANRDEDFEVLCELFEGQCPLLPISASLGRNLELFKQRVFEMLGVMRVYARPPGKEPDLERPFVLKQGSTIADLAAKIHKDFVENLKSARVWGSSEFDGQMVQREYVLHDGDVVELRA
jgi:ribosome-interacting GTPase 1